MSRSFLSVLWLAAGVTVALLALANIERGELNQDEGWYLYAAGEVARGRLPYRDFAFTQGPLLPLVYSLANPLVERCGVAGGRLFTAALGLFAAGIAAGLAGRLAPVKREAALMAFVLCAVNVYQSYFTAVVKTYALCALFLAAGFAMLEAAVRSRSTWRAAVSGALLAAAAGTRISSGLALAVCGLLLLIRRKELGDARWIAFGLGGAGALAAWSLPFYLAAPEGFLFGMIEYHSLRDGGGLVYKAGFVSRVVQAYFLAICGLIALVTLRLSQAKERMEGESRFTVTAALWTTIAGITLVHALAPFPYDDYQAPLYPLFAAAVAAGLMRAAARLPARAVAMLLAGVFVASVASAVSSPLNQSWFISGRDRIWWRAREKPAMQQLRDAAAIVRHLAAPGSLLLTQDTYLAVEAGMRVPAGMEMGPFCYYRDWDRARAESVRVVNREMLAEILASAPARVAAFSGYGLSIKAPEVEELPRDEQAELRRAVEARYRPVARIAAFGQGATTMELLVAQAGASAP